MTVGMSDNGDSEIMCDFPTRLSPPRGDTMARLHGAVKGDRQGMELR
jgi:hypothetical protein